jgi:tetratricopeptide (TPR) repeat protein
MAPEQRTGHADARSDQYAFARVALEALGGGFESRRRRMPRGLRGALGRASSADPTERFPDMHGLLAALARAQRRRRVAAAAIAVVSSSAVAAALGQAWADPGLHVCTTAATPEALWRAAVDRGAPARVWPHDSPGARAQAHAASERFVAAWSSAAAEVCVHADADADAVVEIASCLEVARADFGRLLESPAAADPVDFLTHLQALDRPAACVDAPGATRPAPSQDEIASVRRLIAEVDRLDADGDPQAAIELAAIAVDEARELGFAPLLVRAELARGTLLADHGQGKAELEHAVRSATELGLDPLRAKGLLALASAALGSGEPELAAAHTQEAEAIVARLGDSASELQIDLYGMKGRLAYGEGAYEDALRHAERAIAICRERVDPRLSKAQFNAGSILQGLGREREALAVFEAARDEMMGELGPDHADVGRAWHSIGAAHNALGEAEAAMPAYDQALRILAQSLGEDHVDTLKAVFGRGNALLQLGRVEEALVSYDACVTAIGRDEQPPALLVFCLDSQAKAHAELGRTREAGNLWRRAYGLAQSRSFAKLPIRATIPFSLAQVDLAEGDPAGARLLMRDAEAAAREAQWDATSLRADIDAWFAAHGR